MQSNVQKYVKKVIVYHKGTMLNIWLQVRCFLLFFKPFNSTLTMEHLVYLEASPA